VTPRERVLSALRLETPATVPYCESFVAAEMYRKVTGQTVDRGFEEFSRYIAPDENVVFDGRKLVEAEKAISRAFGRDNICFPALAPLFVERVQTDSGRHAMGRGLIQSREDLPLLKLPDPDNPELYQSARAFLDASEDFATVLMIRAGIGSTLNTMGLDGFSYALADDPELVREVLTIYADWSRRVVRNGLELGFEVVWAFDDVASRQGPLFSKQVLREVVLPALRRVADSITVPWIQHSDGNLLPIMEDWLSLGMNAIHPIEPEAMDIFTLKKQYGDSVCVIGNVSMDILERGTPAEVRSEVIERLTRLGPKGGYILSSANSITATLEPANVRAMIDAIREHRGIGR